MKEKFSLKDELFNTAKVQKIAREIKAVYPDFDQKEFEFNIVEQFPNLELKERMYHIRDMLAGYLPRDYKEAVDILLKALPSELNTNKYDNDFGDFIYASYSEYIATFGCNREVLYFSFQALREITKRFSVEFAMRDFINTYPEETFQMLELCSLSDNYHERRLASEALRPKLPWAKKINTEYDKAILILDNIFYDKARYVTRSVANHLNDISKIDEALVIATLKRWKASEKQNNKEMEYIITHALRTLIKQGNEKALLLLGYKKDPNILLSDLAFYQDEVPLGESLIFDFAIEAKEDCDLLVDYIIHFKTKSGKTSPKVHKIKKLSLKAGDSIKISKKHPFKANMSTRKLYFGEHKIELQINGVCYAANTFVLNG